MTIDRRRFLHMATALPLVCGAPGRTANALAAAAAPFRTHAWRRDERNPILPPQEPFDRRRAMNPFVLRQEDQYWMFYGGADAAGRHRICLAIADVGDLTRWKRVGPLFENGPANAFDELWCVLPCVHFIGGRWHLYYTGRGRYGAGLQSFRGIGLAVSDDLRRWERLRAEPVLTGDGFAEWPDNQGIAGGGRIVELPQADGRTLYRMHYTLATGRPSKDLRVDQAKQSVVAHSWDGVTWFDKRVVLRPRLEAAYEDSATIALNVWQSGNRWRAIYAGIGTKFGAYSICEAESDDGLVWRRGWPGENLALPPAGSGWESQMTTYPNVIAENGLLRMFYCGNGYGSTGIGTALAEPISEV
jgi:hypothetical protein